MDSGIVSLSEDQTIKCWKFNRNDFDPKLNQTIREHGSGILSSDLKSGKLFSGDFGGFIKVFKFSSEGLELEREFLTGREPVWELDYNPTRDLLLSSTCDAVKFWGLDQISVKNPKFTFLAKDKFYQQASWISREKVMVSFSRNQCKPNGFLIFDLNKQKTECEITQTDTVSNTFRILKEEGLFFSGNEDLTVSLFDLRKKTQIHSFLAHSEPVTVLDVSFQNNLIATTGLDSSLRLWDLRNYKCLREFSLHRKKYDESIFDIKFHPDLNILVSAGADSTLKFFQY